MKSKIQAVVLEYDEHNNTEQKFHTAKYTIGDRIYYLDDCGVKTGIIDGVKSTITNDTGKQFVVNFSYEIAGCFGFKINEDYAYSSFEELVEDLKGHIEDVSEE
jgi:hypothetical protein